MTYDPPPGSLSRTAIVMYSAAVLILVALGLWGALLYPNLPDTIPTHWNLRGEADAFSQKSIMSFFGPMLLAAAFVVLMLIVQLAMSRSLLQVPAERRALDLTLGYVSLSLVVIMAWVSVAAWYSHGVGPLFVALALLAGVPVLVIYGLNYPEIHKQRQALADSNDPSMNPKYWVLNGFFYNNPKDPRAFVPKPRHTGTGVTMNLATPGGRLALIGLLLVIGLSVALPFIL